MAYTNKNFPSKAALKRAVAAGERITVYQRNDDLTGAQVPRNGNVSVEGPHWPKPHRWYASVTLVDGVITNVK